MYLRYLVKMKHHISYFYNALLEYYQLHQAWRETENSSSTEKTNWQPQDMFKMSTTGTNACTQACWPLVNCVINQRLFEASPHMQQTLSQLMNVITVTSYLRHTEN